MNPATSGQPARQFINPFVLAAIWLTACLLLGGASNGGAVANLMLQLGAIVIIGLTIWRGIVPALARPERTLAIGLALLAIWIGLTLIPLPPALWTYLPGRTFVADGYRLLGLDLPWLPISLADERTVRGLLALSIPIATYLCVRPLVARDRMKLAALVGAFAIVSVAMGMAQLATGQASPLRFYAVTNRGNPVGFFANSNHLVTLLLVSIPLVFAAGAGLRGRLKRGEKRREWRPIVLGAAAFFVLGLALSGSNAALLLMIPALAGALLVGPLRHWAQNRWVLRGLALATVLAFAGIAFSLTGDFLQQKVGTSATSRAQITSTTLDAARDYMPVGSGLGTFPAIYLKHSGGELTSSEWMNHAHDDWAEVVLELGFPGLTLLLACIVWLAMAAWRAWTDPDTSDPLQRAATLSAGLIATHSLVDYPLRTAAIAAVFGVLLAFAASPAPSEAN